MGFSTRHIHNTEATMTDAPDPGLTDLIAADLKSHTWGHEYENAAHEDHTFDGGCKVCRGDVDAIAARALLVVEQHTNGRIAELEVAVRKRIQLLREHDGFGAAHADGYMGMNWTAYYEGAYQAQVMAAADLENDLRTALEGEQQ